MAVKMSKMTHFLYFLLNTASGLVWPKYLSASESFHLVLLENTIDNFELLLGRCQHLEIQDFGILLLTQ